ncbi:MAG TPA: adenylate/guanylate cyclase domain-containing protein [Acidimicrobiales bacterium]|jgi:adenylate cyclase|nr:adenylate/guanylate cyclase domain-containing protein [Acidimicrobiales bacterium]
MRVERTFAFVDLCGFTAFTEAEGDKRAVEVLADFRSCMRQVASDNGVRVAKWLGDGAMFVAVDEGRTLVEAVLEVERQLDAMQAPLALRAGMARGPVILFEGDDYIGTAVNLAARLCDIAAPHEVLATPSITDVPEGVLIEPGGPVKIAGFPRRIPVIRLRRRGHWAATPRTA